MLKTCNVELLLSANLIGWLECESVNTLYQIHTILAGCTVSLETFEGGPFVGSVGKTDSWQRRIVSAALATPPIASDCEWYTPEQLKILCLMLFNGYEFSRLWFSYLIVFYKVIS